jgi:P27 family predicted phage terminase small subunit
MKKRTPPAPKNLSPDALTFWRRIHKRYEVTEDARPALVECVEAMTRKEQAQAAIEKDGLIVQDRFGQDRAHPAVAIERDARLAILRCLRVIGLPAAEEKQRGRPTR